MWEALHKKQAFGVDFFMAQVIKTYAGHIINDKEAARKIMGQFKAECDLQVSKLSLTAD